MPPKKKPSELGADSPFKSADKLFKEDTVKSENQKRFERWTDVIVREKKISADWKKDPDADAKAKWVGGKTKISPVQKKSKS